MVNPKGCTRAGPDFSLSSLPSALFLVPPSSLSLLIVSIPTLTRYNDFSHFFRRPSLAQHLLRRTRWVHGNPTKYYFLQTKHYPRWYLWRWEWLQMPNWLRKVLFSVGMVRRYRRILWYATLASGPNVWIVCLPYIGTGCQSSFGVYPIRTSDSLCS